MKLIHGGIARDIGMRLAYGVQPLLSTGKSPSTSAIPDGERQENITSIFERGELVWIV